MLATTRGQGSATRRAPVCARLMHRRRGVLQRLRTPAVHRRGPCIPTPVCIVLPRAPDVIGVVGCTRHTQGRWALTSLGLESMDTLGFEPRALRTRSGCDTTTPCARCPGTVPGVVLTPHPPPPPFTHVAATSAQTRAASRLGRLPWSRRGPSSRVRRPADFGPAALEAVLTKTAADAPPPTHHEHVGGRNGPCKTCLPCRFAGGKRARLKAPLRSVHSDARKRGQ